MAVFAAPRSNRSFDFLELAREAARLGLEGEIAVVTDNELHDPVFPNGCAVCEAEIDPETGWVDITRYTVVDDVGRCINPLIVHGQTHGGAAQEWARRCGRNARPIRHQGSPYADRLWITDATLRQSAVLHDRDRRSAVAD
jgi:hypothetical protein